MVWDHSDIGASIAYRVSNEKYLTIKVGERGIQEFDILVRLSNEA
jgi:hypothetical protein